MKKLILIVVLVVAGYFAYQHFYVAPQEEAVVEEEAAPVDSSTFYHEPAPPIPEACKTLAKNLENAIYGNQTGQVSFAQRNTAYRKLQSCLRAEGLSGSDMERVIKELETRVKGYLNQDGSR